MRVVRVTEEVPTGGRINFHHITDTHFGAPDFAEDALLERVALIKADPFARWGFGGDAGELIRHNDPRYEPSSIHPRYRQATDLRAATKEHVVETFAEIVDKCWYWADGNHERAMDKWFGGHFGVEVCCDLGVEDRYVDYRGFCAVTFQRNQARLPLLIDIQHGWQVGRLKGAPHVQAERELGMTEADLVVRGHNHAPMAHQFQTLAVSSGRRPTVVQRTRTVINGGSWRRGYVEHEPVNRKKISEVEKASWGETKGFRAEQVGGPVVVFRPEYGYGRKDGFEGKPMSVEHTVIEGRIDAAMLGLAA